MSQHKFFNTAGPCVPGKHYMVPVEPNFARIKALIRAERYFILHAPRQTGKTTLFLQLMEQLNQESEYIALYINAESAQPLRGDVEAVNNTLLSIFENAAAIYLPADYHPSERCFVIRAMQEGLKSFLQQWCLELPKPLVMFMDEVDALIGDGLISVLRQLRAGYSQRPRAFPQSLCLIGVRDIRDYRIYSDSSQRYIIGGSAFNIKEESIRLGNFDCDQVKALYAQHVQATDQVFSEAAVQRAFYYSQGQPWLVNALGRELCFGPHAVPRDQAVQSAEVDRAAEILIQRRDVHLDQLADKLTEPRVARIIEDILTGEEKSEEDLLQGAPTGSNLNEDKQYLIDLGLVKNGTLGLEIANPIYREVIPRELTAYRQDMIGQNPAWYVKEDGRLAIDKVIDAYIDFYKEHSELVTRRKTYTEAAHHLLFMAWLQRIVNGGGTIAREYAAGMGRLDLCIDFCGERFAFELKLSGAKALERGRVQLAAYLDRLGLKHGWLIIFSRVAVTDWGAVGRREMLADNGKQIEVVFL